MPPKRKRQSSGASPPPKYEGLRKSARNATTAKTRLSYDQRYHPMDESTKPTAARRRRHMYGIDSQKQNVISLDSDSEDDSNVNNSEVQGTEQAEHTSALPSEDRFGSPTHLLGPSKLGFHAGDFPANAADANVSEDETQSISANKDGSPDLEHQTIVLASTRKGNTTVHSKPTAHDASVQAGTGKLNLVGSHKFSADIYQEEGRHLAPDAITTLEQTTTNAPTIHHSTILGPPATVVTPVTIDHFAQIYTKAWEALVDDGRPIEKIERVAQSYAQAWEDSAKPVEDSGQETSHIHCSPHDKGCGVGPEFDAGLIEEMMAMFDANSDDTQYRDEDNRVIQDSQYRDDIEGDGQPAQEVQGSEVDDEETSESEEDSGPSKEPSAHATPIKPGGNEADLETSKGLISMSQDAIKTAAEELVKKVLDQDSNNKDAKAKVEQLLKKYLVQDAGKQPQIQQRPESGGKSTGTEDFHSASEHPKTANNDDGNQTQTRPVTLRLYFTPRSKEKAAHLAKQGKLQNSSSAVRYEYPGMMTGEWLETLQSLTQSVNEATSQANSNREDSAPSTPSKLLPPPKGLFCSPKSAPTTGRRGRGRGSKLTAPANTSLRRITSAGSVFGNANEENPAALKGILKNTSQRRVTSAGSVVGNGNEENSSAMLKGILKNTNTGRNDVEDGNSNGNNKETSTMPQKSVLKNINAFERNRNLPGARGVPVQQDKKIFNSGGLFDDDSLNAHANAANRIISAKFKAANGSLKKGPTNTDVTARSEQEVLPTPLATAEAEAEAATQTRGGSRCLLG